MEKNNILSKLNINIRDYNNELEKILENKLFSYDVKNLLLSMLYKIENSYKDYEAVKVEVPSKREYIENILRIIKEKTIKIFLVKSGTPEGEELEKNKLLYKIDKENGEIVCFQNEIIMLTALYKLDETDDKVFVPYEYIKEPLNKLINTGKLDSMVEVLRDFNGWSWNLMLKEIKDLDYNFVYESALLLDAKKHIESKDYQDLKNMVMKFAMKKYLMAEENSEYKDKIEETKKSKQEKLKQFENKKEFVSQVTEEKKECTKQIERIDRMLNDNELLKKEYYERNSKLPNKDKIFSVSYLVRILVDEREKLLDKIDDCNKIILPKEFINQKTIIEKEANFLDSLQGNITNEDKLEIAEEFLKIAEKQITRATEETKQELIKWMYKIRYYRFIPIDKESFVKDVVKLEDKFERIIKLIIKKAQEFKIWEVFTENTELTYRILKEVFNTKIIYLQNINFQCRNEGKTLYIEIYDDNIIESAVKFGVEGEVKIKKKIKLFI